MPLIPFGHCCHYLENAEFFAESSTHSMQAMFETVRKIRALLARLDRSFINEVHAARRIKAP
jgi:hypothetical protein